LELNQTVIEEVNGMFTSNDWLLLGAGLLALSVALCWALWYSQEILQALLQPGVNFKGAHVTQVSVKWGNGFEATMYQQRFKHASIAALYAKVYAAALKLCLPQLYWTPVQKGLPAFKQYGYTIERQVRQLTSAESRDFSALWLMQFESRNLGTHDTLVYA
jgi:hypothetical protein